MKRERGERHIQRKSEEYRVRGLSKKKRERGEVKERGRL